MPDPLRPLSSFELLIKTLELYRRNCGLFLATAMIGPAAIFLFRTIQILQKLATGHLSSASVSMSSLVWTAVGNTGLLLILLPFSVTPTVEVVTAAYEGREVRVAEAYRAFKGRIWRIIAISVLTFLRALFTGLLFVLAAAGALGLAATLRYNSREEAGLVGYVCGGIGLAAFIFVFIRGYVHYSAAAPACVLEETSIRQSLQRSTKRNRNGAGLLFGVFLGVAVLMQFAVIWIALLLRSHAIAFQVVTVIAGVFAGVFISPVGTIGCSLVYNNQLTSEPLFSSTEIAPPLR